MHSIKILIMMEAHERLLCWAMDIGIELIGIRPQRIPSRGTGVVATRRLKVMDPTIILESQSDSDNGQGKLS